MLSKGRRQNFSQKKKGLFNTVIFKLRMGSLKEKQSEFKGNRDLKQFVISITHNCISRLESTM